MINTKICHTLSLDEISLKSKRDDKFTRDEIYAVQIGVTDLKDIKGNIIYKRKELEFCQFRELFVQE